MFQTLQYSLYIFHIFSTLLFPQKRLSMYGMWGFHSTACQAQALPLVARRSAAAERPSEGWHLVNYVPQLREICEFCEKHKVKHTCCLFQCQQMSRSCETHFKFTLFVMLEPCWIFNVSHRFSSVLIYFMFIFECLGSWRVARQADVGTIRAAKMQTRWYGKRNNTPAPILLRIMIPNW